MGEFAAGAFQGTAALVPWLAENAKLGYHTAKKRYKAHRKLRAYRELQHWTRSSLQISCVFDWGNTCELGLAVHDSAVLLLEKNTCQSNWVFTSRTLVSQAIQEDIDTDTWAKFVIHFIYSDIDPSLIHGNADLSKILVEHWVRSHATDSNDRISAGKERMLRASAPLRLAQQLFKIYSGDYVLLRTCELKSVTMRDRALRNTSCNGLRLYGGQKVPTCNAVFDADGWRQLQIHWRMFQDSWDDITKLASERFPFPSKENLSDLLFHDMMTGYVQSSAMLRKGAKWTGEGGTVIVHPGERGAIVPLEGAFITLEGSAVKRHAPERPYDNASTEFARYALLRCSLVKQKRMTFSSALEDWSRTYVTWDCAPATLSEWKRDDDDLERGGDGQHSYGDEMRIVLLRQALGEVRSIRILSGRDSNTILGDYVHGVDDGIKKQTDVRTIVIDAAFRLRVRFAMYKLASKVENDEVFYVLRDPWAGGMSEVHGESGRKVFSKIFLPSGHPDLYQMGATVKIRKYDISVVPGSRKDAQAFHGKVRWLGHEEGTFCIF